MEAKTRKVVTVKVVDPMGDIMYSDSDISHEDYDIISLYADFDGKYQVCFGGGDKDTSVYLAVEGGDYLLKTEGAAKKTVDSMLADVVEMKRVSLVSVQTSVSVCVLFWCMNVLYVSI